MITSRYLKCRCRSVARLTMISSAYTSPKPDGQHVKTESSKKIMLLSASQHMRLIVLMDEGPICEKFNCLAAP